MKTIVQLILIAIISASCIRKMTDPLLEKYNPHYTIQGTLYSMDGITPLQNKQLLLIVDMPREQFVDYKDRNYTQLTTTDSEGKFTFTYPTLDVKKSSTLSISPPYEDFPTRGEYIRDIPLHQNITRDICEKPFSRLILKFDLPFNSSSDTFFFHSSIYYADENYIKIDRYVSLPITKSSPTTLDYKIVNDRYQYSFNPSDHFYIIAKGRDEFLTLAENGLASKHPNYVEHQKLLRFPETTQWTVKYMAP
jgi:hypothetical protein